MAQKQNSSQKKKSRKKLWIILTVASLAVIALIIWGVISVKNMAEGMTKAMGSNTQEVEKGSIEVITEGTGVIEAARTVSENIDYNVKLLHLYIQDGQAVQPGQMIAEFGGIAMDESISAMQAQLSAVDEQLQSASKNGDTTAGAPAAGRVKRIFASEGDSVLTVLNEYPGLAEISADGKLKVSFEAQTALVPGQAVTILYGDERVEGQIQEVKGSQATAVFSDSDKYALDVEVSVLNTEDVPIGTGKVESSHPIYVLADGGTVKSISIKENEKVSAGTTILKLEDTGYSASYIALLEQRQQLAQKLVTAREYQKGYIVTAKSAGIVSEMTAKEGDTLPAGSVFCKLLDTTTYQASLDIDELDIKGIANGQSVLVTADAAGDTVYEGTVSNVSLAGSNENGVAGYQVNVLLNSAEGLLPGMSVNGKITVDTREGVLLVPLDAIQTVDGKKAVTVVKKDGTTESRNVTLGLVNNENAEITEGLSEGEKVQLIMKLEDIYSQMGITMESNTETD